MRGIGHTLSRFSSARLMLAGATLLAAAHAPAAFAGGKAGNDQTAMAIPRIGTPTEGGGFAALPQPLSPGDAAQVRRIFADQAAGRMSDAAALTAGLRNPVLLGSLRADLYLGPYHHSTVPELTTWLTRFGTQPDAPAIRALLLRRLAPGAALTPTLAGLLSAKLPARFEPPVPPPATPLGARDPAADSTAASPWLLATVTARGRANAVTAAERMIAGARYLRPPAVAALRAALARGLFAANRDTEALRIAAGAARVAPAADAGPPAFVAGLAAWRMHDLMAARTYFAAAARARAAGPGLRAAGAYWAGRAARRLGHPGAAARWFRQAAASGQSFYGLIARRALGWDPASMLAHATLTEADLDALDALPQGKLVFALLQVGQTARAEAALRLLWPALGTDRLLRQTAMLVAARAGMGALAAGMATRIEEANGVPPETLGFPLPDLRPLGGFRVDPALVYGVIRAESNFQPGAVSPAGARGLMQITPGTARAVTGNPHLTEASLRDPAFNLDVGQSLVRSLAGQRAIDGQLIAMLASYNAGLGSYQSWRQSVRAGGDPLLFVEAIPIRQTRIFVERALAYTWLFAARMGRPAPGLDDIAGGVFPSLSGPAARPQLLVDLR